jgi:hypothetical protein
MLQFALCAIMLGLILSGSFSVLVLVPILACAFIIAAVISLAAAGGLAPIMVGFIVFTVCLQVGYLCGAGIRNDLFRGLGPRHTALGTYEALGRSLP